MTISFNVSTIRYSYLYSPEFTPRNIFPNQISVTVPPRQPWNHNFSGHLIWERESRGEQARPKEGNRKQEMQRRTCRVCLAFVFYIFLPGGSRYFYMVRSSRIYIERDAGAAGQDRDYRRRTEPETGIPGTKLLHHSAWSGLRRHCSHDVYVANIRAQFPERCPPQRPFPPLLPPPPFCILLLRPLSASTDRCTTVTDHL